MTDASDPKEELEQKEHVVATSKEFLPRKFILNFFVQFFVVAVLFFGIGFVVGQKNIELSRKGLIPQIRVSNQSPTEVQDVDFSLFWQVFNTLPETYLNRADINGQDLLYGAISGMVRSLGDPYTAFLNPEQFDQINDTLSGTYEGVGIQIGFNDDKRLVIIAPLKGTPAEKAGVRAKDLILEIEEDDTFDITLPEAVEKIRGEAGTKVKLLLQHEGDGEPFEAEIERAEITVKSVEVEYRVDEVSEVAIVNVSRFGTGTDSEWDSVVAEIIERGVDKVIVDMRNNPGGLLSSSVHIAGEFVGGTIVKQETADGNVTSLPAGRDGKLLDVDLVVLINQGSASASEIFAGAIQDKDRGTIIGVTSFGKGTVQDSIDLPGGSGLHVTIAKWLTPNGTSIHGEGIEPDIKVERSQEEINNEIDPQLERALDII